MPAAVPHKYSRMALTFAVLAGLIPLASFIIGLVIGPGVAKPNALNLFGALQLLSMALTVTALSIGITAIVAIRKEPARFTGRSKSVIAICVSGAMLMFWAYVLIFVVPPAFREMRRVAERENMRKIIIAIEYYDEDNLNRPLTVPTKLHKYLSRNHDYQAVMNGPLNPSPQTLPTKDDELPAELASYAKLDPKDVPVGAYQFGGYWFVVNPPRFKIKDPNRAFIVFSRRFHKGQAERGVWSVSGAPMWLKEEEFRKQLIKVNEDRAAAGMKPIVVDD